MKRNVIRISILISSIIIIFSLVIFKVYKLHIYNHYKKEHNMEMKCNASILNINELNQIRENSNNKENLKSIDIAKIGKKLKICPKNIDDDELVFIRSDD